TAEATQRAGTTGAEADGASGTAEADRSSEAAEAATASEPGTVEAEAPGSGAAEAEPARAEAAEADSEPAEPDAAASEATETDAAAPEAAEARTEDDPAAPQPPQVPAPCWLDTETALTLLASPLAGMDAADLRRLGRALREEERAAGNPVPPPSDELLARALAEP
ncbi:ATP-dependent helicase, partial [Streptomyces sp. SID9944]|nr:ATP-dependent helicase [Streptomyces sp. SID9944]